MDLQGAGEELFMPSEVLMSTEDSDQWDALVSQGVGSETTVSKWDRESLFIKFDPLVSSQSKNERLELNETSPIISDNTSGSYKPNINDGAFGNISVAEKIKPSMDEHIFAIPKPKTPIIVAKLMPVETTPSKKFAAIPIIAAVSPADCLTEESLTGSHVTDEYLNGVPPPEEPLNGALVQEEPLNGALVQEEPLNGAPVQEEPLNEAPVPEEPQLRNTSTPFIAEYGTSFPICRQINGPSKKEIAIQEAQTAQKEFFLSQLVEKEKMIQELLETESNGETAALFEDQNTNRTLTEYAKTMSSYIQQINEVKPKLARDLVEKLDFQKERDQALEDLKHVEDSFTLLHQKYDRVKGTLENLRKNEEIMKNRDHDLIVKLDNRNKGIKTVKEESINAITAMCQEFEVKYSTLQSENLRMKAQLRKNEMTVEMLGQNLEQKQKEHVELNKLCEELISGGLDGK